MIKINRDEKYYVRVKSKGIWFMYDKFQSAFMLEAAAVPKPLSFQYAKKIIQLEKEKDCNITETDIVSEKYYR